MVMLGNSFVRRLDRDGYVENHMELYRTNISWVGYVPEGRRKKPLNLISDLVMNLDEVMQPLGMVEIVYLFLGSNDLCYYWDDSADTIADWVYHVARKLCQKYHVKRVVFVENLSRFGNGGFSRAPHLFNDSRFSSVRDIEHWYHSRSFAFNRKLKYWAAYDWRCAFMPMKGFHYNTRKWLIDGIHPGWQGRDKLRGLLRRSIIIQSLKACR